MAFKIHGMMKDFKPVIGRQALEGLRVEASKKGIDLDKEIAAKGFDFSADLTNDKVLYFRAKMLGYDLPNGNGDAISRIFAADFGPSFIGKHLDVNHETDVEHIIGKVVSTFHVEAAMPGEPGTERIIGLNALADDDSDATRELQLEGICRIDRNTELGEIVAQKLIAGTVDGVSQEASTEFAECSVCKHKVGSPFDPLCAHLENGSLMIQSYQVEGRKNKVLAYKNHYNPVGTGLAVVPTPAYDRGRVQQMQEQVRAGKLSLAAALLDLKQQAILHKKPEHIMAALAELEKPEAPSALTSALAKLDGHETLAIMEHLRKPAEAKTAIQASAAEAWKGIQEIYKEQQEQRKWVAKAEHTDMEISAYVAKSPALGDKLWKDTELTAQQFLDNYRCHLDREEHGVQLWDVDGSFSIVVDGRLLILHADNVSAVRFYDKVIAWAKKKDKKIKAMAGENTDKSFLFQEWGTDFADEIKRDPGFNSVVSQQRAKGFGDYYIGAGDSPQEAALDAVKRAGNDGKHIEPEVTAAAKAFGTEPVEDPDDEGVEYIIALFMRQQKLDAAKVAAKDLADVAIQDVSEGQDAAKEALRLAEEAKALLRESGLGEAAAEKAGDAENAADTAKNRLGNARQMADAVSAAFFRQPEPMKSYWAVFGADGKILTRVSIGALCGGKLNRSLSVAGKKVSLGQHLTSPAWAKDLIVESERRGIDAVLAELKAAEESWGLKLKADAAPKAPKRFCDLPAVTAPSPADNNTPKTADPAIHPQQGANRPV